MRMLTFIFGLGIATLAAAQQQQPQQPPQQQPEPSIDKDTQARIRVDGAAGGTGNITPEQKAGANAGAGPHLSRPPSGPSRERVENKKFDKSEPAEQSSRGGTR